MLEGYLGLFATSFLASTLVPAYSEAAVLGLWAVGYPPLALWAWATAGNTLGASLNWTLGRYLLHFQDRRWFPFKRHGFGLAQRWFQRFGVWTLLFSWAPFVGDVFTFLAGVMRVSFPLFLVLTAAGKAARYAAVLWVAGRLVTG